MEDEEAAADEMAAVDLMNFDRNSRHHARRTHAVIASYYALFPFQFDA
jgi:hypothetical protein